MTLQWIRKHALLTFFILAYAFSWMVEIPLVFSAQGVATARVPFALHYLAGYGPLISALIVTRITGGSDGLRELWERMIHWRVKPGWWLVAVSPLGIYLLASMALWLIQGQKLDLAAMGEVDYLPPLGLVAIPLWILTFGIGEETGWRGFALPRLQKGRSALSATFLLWLSWALWHSPMFFYAYDPIIIPGMLIGLLAGSIIFTWLYNSIGGSVLITAIWHGLFNYTTACTSCKIGLIPAFISTLVMLWAVVVVIRLQPADLVHKRKQTTLCRRDA